MAENTSSPFFTEKVLKWGVVLQKPSDQTGMDQPINWEHWDHLSTMRLEVLTKMAAWEKAPRLGFAFTGERKNDGTPDESGNTRAGRRVSVVSFPPTMFGKQQLCYGEGKPAAAFVC